MATYVVTKVRRELSSDGTHKHLEGVITESGIHYSRREVVDSIKAGHIWKTRAGGHSATITTLSYCFRSVCLANPYIKTNPNSSELDNLENLPEG